MPAHISYQDKVKGNIFFSTPVSTEEDHSSLDRIKILAKNKTLSFLRKRGPCRVLFSDPVFKTLLNHEIEIEITFQCFEKVSNNKKFIFSSVYESESFQNIQSHCIQQVLDNIEQLQIPSIKPNTACFSGIAKLLKQVIFETDTVEIREACFSIPTKQEERATHCPIVQAP